MILGNISDVEQFAKMDHARRDSALQAVLDEFRTNPAIDKEIRGNKVIMQELSKAVHRTFDPTFDVKKE